MVVCFRMLSWDGLVTCQMFAPQLGQAPAPTSTQQRDQAIDDGWMDGCVNVDYHSTVTQNFRGFSVICGDTVSKSEDKHIKPDHQEETNIYSSAQYVAGKHSPSPPISDLELHNLAFSEIKKGKTFHAIKHPA